MPLSPYFLQGSTSEQRLVQDLINEQLKIYGQDVVYLPRKIVNKKSIIKEIVASTFDDAYRLEAYLLNYQGFEGSGDILSKFGVKTTDAVNLVVSKERYEDFITPFLGSDVEVSTRPQEGDLVFLPLDNTMFEIKYVEARKPFYQLNNLYVYTLSCEVMDAEIDQDIDTSIEAVDTAVDQFGYITTLTMVGLGASTATATVQKATTPSGLTDGDGLGYIDLINDGTGYTVPPTIGISTAPSGGINATAVAIMTSRTGQVGESIDRILLTNPGFGYTVPPTVTIRSANVLGSGGIATAVIGVDGVSAATVTDGGNQYGAIPNVKVSTSTPGATATALVGTATSTSSTVGFITGFTITNGGMGYKTAPTVTVDAPPTRTGVVTAWSPPGINYQGLGFAVGDVCLIKPATGYTVGTGTDAYVKVTAVDGSGRITANEVIYGGHSYRYSYTYQIDPPRAGGTRAIEQLVGSNFLGADDDTVDSGTQATATASITAGVVTSITITNAGAGYSTAPAVTISNIGSNKNPVSVYVDALAEAVLNTNNEVAAIRFSNAGAGYTVSPTIIIDPPAAAGFATGNYQYKELVRGVSSGTTAHVQSWDYDQRILKVTRPSGSFVPGEAVVGIGTTMGGTDTKYIVKTASDQDEEDTFNENTPFETEADALLDFTEDNPFGEF